MYVTQYVSGRSHMFEMITIEEYMRGQKGLGTVSSDMYRISYSRTIICPNDVWLIGKSYHA